MFLFLDDYNKLITTEDLNTVLGNDDSIRLQTEVASKEFISMYIRQRYDVDKIFKDWTTWSYTKAYIIDDYFKYTESVFNSTTNYTTGQRVSYGGYIYSANSSISHGIWNASQWTRICLDNLIFKCIASSTSHWPENITYFTQTDPRNAEIVNIMLNVVLYRIHTLIVPDNIPTLRRILFNSDGNLRKMDGSAVGTLIAIQNGDIMVDLPIYTDTQEGQNITYGSNMKRNNSY